MFPDRPSRRILLAGLSALALSGPAGAADPPHTVFAEGGVAIRGTDPVAYVTEGRPVRGRAEFHHAWGGATWRFASAANRDAFAADPARYAPAYGGFCAYAVSEGYTAPIDPQAWRIVDGRLFLNYDLRTRSLWERDRDARISRADAHWPRLAPAR